MPGSSLRNSVNRRNHKERSQLASRSRLGLLEKHKDYVLRARDYASKKARLKALQSKIAFKNQDEFYYGMTRSRTQGGVHIQSRGNAALPVDVVRTLKTQDVGFVRTQIKADRSRIEHLKSDLQALTDLFPELGTASSSFSKTKDIDFEDLSDEGSSEGGDEEEEDEAPEAIDWEILVKHGIVDEAAVPASAHRDAMPGSSKGKGKMPYRKDQVLRKGHIVFADDRETLNSYDASRSAVALPAKTPISHSEGDLEHTSPDAESLGWIDPTDPKGKRRAKLEKRKVDAERRAEQQAEDQKEVTKAQERLLRREGKIHRQRLLSRLSGLLNRVDQLTEIERYMNLQRQLMTLKGGHIKKRAHERLPKDEIHPDDEMGATSAGDGALAETGGKLGWKTMVVKWKAERRR